MSPDFLNLLNVRAHDLDPDRRPYPG